jgi:hypothetical protein
MKTNPIVAGNLFVLSARIILLLLFAYTATSKLIEHGLFVFQMRLAPLPYMINLAPILGWLIPTIEAILAAALYTQRYYIKALYGSGILLCLFEAYIVAMMLSGSHLPCSCGGIISTLSWKAHLVINALLVLLTIIALRMQSMITDQSDVKNFSRVSR